MKQRWHRQILAAFFAVVGLGALALVVYSQAEEPSAMPPPLESAPIHPHQAETEPSPESVSPPVPPPVNFNYTAVDEFGHNRFTIDSRKIFQAQALPNLTIRTAPSKLLRVLRNTRHYFEVYGPSDPVSQREGILAAHGVTREDVLRTLDFMIATLTEDISNKRPIRLQNSRFINENFRVIAWRPHNPRDPQQTQQLRLTKYAVFTHRGSRHRTATQNVALYALPDNANEDFFYRNYTKQEVLSGIYEPGGKEANRGVKPLAYLTRAAFEDALMQGTILIQFPDGSESFFNVDRNNNIAFVRGVDPYQQKRYWYFREVQAIKGYGSEITNKIDIEPEVTFAGDVHNIGLGRVVMLEDRAGGGHKLRLGVIADTGGAFIPNLYQLDFLAGVFPTRQAYQRVANQLPEYVKAYILIKK